MKNLVRTAKYFFVFIFMLSFSFCQGPEGDIGPAGEDGNANVISSDWFTPNSYNLKSNSYGKEYIEYDHSAPEITQDIVDKGVILVYGMLNGYPSDIWPSNTVSLLPISLTYAAAGEQIETWTAIVSEANIKIRYINSSNDYLSASTNHSFRYIIIPSSNTSAGRTGSLTRASVLDNLLEAGIDINNIEAVAEYFKQ